MERRRVLVLFGRPPRPGAVKTRLAAVLGATGAARLYAAFLADVSRPARPHVDETVLHLAPPFAPASVAGLVPRGMRVEEQRGDGLADRLEDAFRAEFERGAAAVVVRNTDSPLLPAAREREAFERLEAGDDLVFGPDEGGGYYLVGMSRPHPGMFAGVPTSVPTNFEATLARARERVSRVGVLGVEPDIDTPADLDRLAGALAADPAAAGRAPATARELLARERSA